MNLLQKFLKLFYPVLIRIGKLTNKNRKVITHPDNKSHGFYDLSFTLTDGKLIDASSLAGKKNLIVNTASGCGYTAQYAQLETLAKTYPGVTIICFPSNDFKQQEKQSDKNIASFCQINYGSKFMLAKKTVVVHNDEQHPIYQWLSDPLQNGFNDKQPSWNFCKYLVDEKGNLLGFFEAGIEPDEQCITDLLQR